MQTHSPTGTHFKNLLEAIDLYSAYQHLPKLYIGIKHLIDVMNVYIECCYL